MTSEARTQEGSPNPGGRPKYSGEWGDAIRKVLHELKETPDGERKKRLYAVGEALVSAAENGDVSAIKEIGDRIDGKAKQPIGAEVTVRGDIAALLQRRRVKAGLEPASSAAAPE